MVEHHHYLASQAIRVALKRVLSQGVQEILDATQIEVLADEVRCHCPTQKAWTALMLSGSDKGDRPNFIKILKVIERIAAPGKISCYLDGQHKWECSTLILHPVNAPFPTRLLTLNPEANDDSNPHHPTP